MTSRRKIKSKSSSRTSNSGWLQPLPLSVDHSSRASVASSVSCSVLTEEYESFRDIPYSVQRAQEEELLRSVKNSRNQQNPGDGRKEESGEFNTLTQLFALYDSLLDELTTANLRLRAARENAEGDCPDIDDMGLSRDEVLQTLDELRSLCESAKQNSRRSNQRGKGSSSTIHSDEMSVEDTLDELSVLSKSIASSVGSNSLIDRNGKLSSQEKWEKSRQEAKEKLEAHTWILKWVFQMHGGKASNKNGGLKPLPEKNVYDDRPSIMSVKAFKDCQEAKLGISFRDANGSLQVSSIDPNGLLGDTPLRKGDFVVNIDDFHDCGHWNPTQAALYLKECVGYVKLVVRNPFGDIAMRPYIDFEGERSQKASRDARLRLAEKRYDSLFPCTPSSPRSGIEETESSALHSSTSKHRRSRQAEKSNAYEQESNVSEEQLKSDILRIKQRYKQW